jgi:hypothetical protein
VSRPSNEIGDDQVVGEDSRARSGSGSGSGSGLGNRDRDKGRVGEDVCGGKTMLTMVN